MKWFKHMSNAHGDDALVEIRELFGMWGIGVWWDLVERVAEQYKLGGVPSVSLSVKELSQFYACRPTKLASYLLAIARLGLGQLVASAWPYDSREKLLIISIPNLPKLNERYAKKCHPTATLLPPKNRSEQKRREETEDPLSLSQKNETQSELDSQAGTPETVSPPPNLSGPGSGISKAGDVADGLMGDTGKTAAIFEDPRPVGAEHDEILNLRQLHAKRFNYDLNPCAPVGDLSCRILDALREYGLTKCRAAIEGHYKEATKEGSPRGRGFEHAFPPLGRQKNKLDRDRFWTLITAGQKGSGKSARSTYKPTKKLSDAEQKAAEKKRKEILAEMGIGK